MNKSLPISQFVVETIKSALQDAVSNRRRVEWDLVRCRGEIQGHEFKLAHLIKSEKEMVEFLRSSGVSEREIIDLTAPPPGTSCARVDEEALPDRHG